MTQLLGAEQVENTYKEVNQCPDPQPQRVCYSASYLCISSSGIYVLISLLEVTATRFFIPQKVAIVTLCSN